jgi:hypothetical protein
MAGGAETPNIAALPAIARLGTCESARGPDADRHVKLLIQFAVEGSLSGAYSHDKCFVLRCAPNLTWPQRARFRGTKRTSRRSRRMSAVRGIVLQKPFWGDERKFSEPLMRFVDGNVRDHIVSHKNDPGPSYRRYRALQR